MDIKTNGRKPAPDLNFSVYYSNNFISVHENKRMNLCVYFETYKFKRLQHWETYSFFLLLPHYWNLFISRICQKQ